MTDSQMVALLIQTLTAGLVTFQRPATVLQSYQPTQQGTDPRPAVYLHSLSAKPYGFWGQKQVGAGAPDVSVLGQEQYWERTFQIDALGPDIAPVDTPDLTAPVAFDYVVAAHAVLQSSQGRAALKAGGVGILRVTDIRTPYFKNDRDRNEMAPSFDFTLKYRTTYTSDMPAIIPPVEPGIYRA